MRREDGRRNIGILPIEKAKGRDAHNVFIKFHLCAQISVPINRKDSSAKNVQEKELARRKHHGAEAPRINTVNALHHQYRIANRSPIAAQATLGLVVAVLHDVVANQRHAREQQCRHEAFAFGLARSGVGEGGEGGKHGNPTARR